MSAQSKIKILNLIDKYERMFKMNPPFIKMDGDDIENLIWR